jgi:hypothetical protein
MLALVPTVQPKVQTLPLTTSDLVCVEDTDPFAAETTSDLQSLEQDVFHILLETNGSNPDDPNRGVGIEEALSGTAEDAAKLPSRIEQQLGEDDRIDACTATLTPQSTGDYTYLLALNIQADGQVLGLSYGFNPQDGLVPLNA